MRFTRAWMAATLLLVSCGPLGIGGASPVPVESWLGVLDEELRDLGGATDWSQDAPLDAAAMCGPVDEVEGWRLLATVPLTGSDSGFEPPFDAWAPTEGGDTGGDGATTWRHRDHQELTLELSREGLRAIVEVPGAGERWTAHPRVEQPFYCG